MRIYNGGYMGQIDGPIDTLIIDGEPYLVPAPVTALIMALTKERDVYAKAFAALKEENK